MTASVFFSSDVANPDTYTKFYADLQEVQQRHERARSRGIPAPVLFVGGRHQGEQVAGAATSRAGQNKEYDAAIEVRPIPRADPIKRADLYIKCNDPRDVAGQCDDPP